MLDFTFAFESFPGTYRRLDAAVITAVAPPTWCRSEDGNLESARGCSPPRVSS